MPSILERLDLVRLFPAQQPLEVADIAVDRGTEVCIPIVAAADLVECRLAVEAVEVAPEHTALSRAEALPDLGGGAVIERARDLIEAKALMAALLGLRRSRRGGAGPLLRRMKRSGSGCVCRTAWAGAAASA